MNIKPIRNPRHLHRRVKPPIPSFHIITNTPPKSPCLATHSYSIQESVLLSTWSSRRSCDGANLRRNTWEAAITNWHKGTRLQLAPTRSCGTAWGFSSHLPPELETSVLMAGCAKEPCIWVAHTLLKRVFILQEAPTRPHFQLGEIIQNEASFCVAITQQCFSLVVLHFEVVESI